MVKALDITGQKFGQLTALVETPLRNNGVVWACKCDCGVPVLASVGTLTSGHTQSCGCAKGGNHEIHGNARKGKYTKTYTAWCGMVSRCENPNRPDYKHYGGRGISVSTEWRTSFETFMSDMGLPPTTKHTLDRIDVNGNYCKENCRWASSAIQVANRRVRNDSTTGISGVTPTKSGKFVAVIKFEGKYHYLGVFSRLADAAAARKAAEEKYWKNS